MLFACVCWDKPEMSQIRERVFHEHLEYLKRQGEKVRVGGPLLNNSGLMVGTMLVIDVSDYPAACEFMKEEVFNKSGVFESLQIRRFRQYQPEVAEGDGELADQAAQLQIRQDNL